LDSGWLSGKYSIDSTFEDIRSRWSKSDLKTRAQLVEKVKSILDLDKEYSLAQAAMAFCLSYDAVSTVIPGNSSLAQLESNIASTRVRLSSKKIRKLEDFYLNEVKELKLPW
jgi:aryl-alcohol dehydrogenase-like predicted oxidoreductase